MKSAIRPAMASLTPNSGGGRYDVQPAATSPAASGPAVESASTPAPTLGWLPASGTRSIPNAPGRSVVDPAGSVAVLFGTAAGCAWAAVRACVAGASVAEAGCSGGFDCLVRLGEGAVVGGSEGVGFGDFVGLLVDVPSLLAGSGGPESSGLAAVVAADPAIVPQAGSAPNSVITPNASTLAASANVGRLR